MNPIDLVLVIILVISAIVGFSRGFFEEFASVASIILGVLCAMLFSGYLKHWLAGEVNWQPETIKAVSFIIIFISVVIVVHLAANLAEKFVEAIALGFFSRLAGAVFGFVKALFILSLLMYLIARIESYDYTIIPKEPKSTSKYYRPIEKLLPNLLPFLREETEEVQKKVMS